MYIRTRTTAWLRSAEFAAFKCPGQILTQRFLHVIFHGRKQELFCRGSEQTRCQLLAGKYHFQPHLQFPTDVSAFQSNGNFMDHFLILLFPRREQQTQNALRNTVVSSQNALQSNVPSRSGRHSQTSQLWVRFIRRTRHHLQPASCIKVSAVQQLSLENLKMSPKGRADGS